jgi:hypothetical protein
MSMSDTDTTTTPLTADTPRARLARAREANAQLQAKGLAAQRIARSLVALESSDPLATRLDISRALIRTMTIVRDMMDLSGSVIAASESAITAAATADKEGDHAP